MKMMETRTCCVSFFRGTAMDLRSTRDYRDKEVEIASVLGIGLLILVLDRRSERDLHEKIHQQHDIINKMNKLIHEQHEFIMDLSNKRKKKTVEK
jgi:hypothetical protein